MDSFRNSKSPSNGMSFTRNDDYGRRAVGSYYAAGRFASTDDDEEEEGDVEPDGCYRGSRGYRSSRNYDHYPPSSSSYRYARYEGWGHTSSTSIRDFRGDEYNSHRAPSISPRDQFGNSGSLDSAGYYEGSSTGVVRHRNVDQDIPSLFGSDTANSSSENSWDEDHWKPKFPEPYTNSRYTLSPLEDRPYSKHPSAAKLPARQLSLDKTKNSSSGMKTIEVSPGEHLRLRGAHETWQAVQVDFYMPCECMCCPLTLFCIQDADFVLCPACKVVSPMAGASAGNDGGVGLGFTLENLAQWQDDIHALRSNKRNYK